MINTFSQCAIITGIGFFLLVFAGWRLLLAVRSWSWPQIQGSVVKSYVMTNSGRGGAKATFLVVVYRYAVEGKTYESERWGFDGRPPRYGSRSPTSGKLMWHESELLAAYPKGTPITVYYDPAKPESSTITRTLGLITYIWLALGITFFLLGGVQLIDFGWLWMSGKSP